MSVSHISANFTWAEAMCHDGAEVPLEYQPHARRLAVEVLEKIRERFGGPIIPLSWYRTPYWNRAVGGVEHSQHLTASAADIRPVEMEALGRLNATIETMIHQGLLPCLGGMGRYGSFTHVDIREKAIPGYVARWHGKGVGSELP